MRDGLAWLEALDGGRSERVAWIADVTTGEMFRLEGTGWLVWILLSEGASTVDEIRAAADEVGARQAFEDIDLPAFLGSLMRNGVLIESDEQVA